jgi:hypothetical protein
MTGGCIFKYHSNSHQEIRDLPSVILTTCFSDGNHGSMKPLDKSALLLFLQDHISFKIWQKAVPD